MTDKHAATLLDLVEVSISKLNQIADTDWVEKASPEKWSKKEVLGHLIDSALTNIQRFVRIQHGDQTNLYYEQDFWVRVNDYQHQELDTIMNLWKSLNLQIVRIWRNTRDADLSKTIPVKDEVPTLSFLMQDYIEHMEHHLNQIFNRA